MCRILLKYSYHFLYGFNSIIQTSRQNKYTRLYDLPNRNGCTPLQSGGLAFGRVLFWWYTLIARFMGPALVPSGADRTHELCYLGNYSLTSNPFSYAKVVFLVLQSFTSLGGFCFWTFFFNIELNSIPWSSFVSNLYAITWSNAESLWIWPLGTTFSNTWIIHFYSTETFDDKMAPLC